MTRNGSPLASGTTTERDAPDVSRRAILRKGAATGTVLAVGGGAATGTAAAQSRDVPCNLRLKQVDDCTGKEDLAAVQRGGRPATAWFDNVDPDCTVQEAERRVWQVQSEITSDPSGVCPEPNGNPDVHCYTMQLCGKNGTAFTGGTREFCVIGELEVGTRWQVTSADGC